MLGFSAVGLVSLIFVFLLSEGLPRLPTCRWATWSRRSWYPTSGLFGMLPLCPGRARDAGGYAHRLCLPLGVGTAVFVREIAPNWAREVLKPTIEVLAGIPSVVLGFFGMIILRPLCARGSARRPV